MKSNEDRIQLLMAVIRHRREVMAQSNNPFRGPDKRHGGGKCPKGYHIDSKTYKCVKDK